VGYTVVAADMPGHGKSPGLKGWLGGADQVVEIGVSIAEYAASRFLPGRSDDDAKKSKLILVGSSMGGTIALAVARSMATGGGSEDKKNAVAVSGVVLLAPMLKLSINTPTRYLLRGLSSLISEWEVIPSSSTDGSKQYRDPEKRKLCEEDEYSNKTGKIRVGSASTCVELANTIQDDFESVRFPILVMIGDEDVVVDNDGSLQLMKNAVSCKDKTLKRYPALHGLLCEPSPLVDQIQDDLVGWVNART